MIGTSCTLGRASRTKDTLPDFHEWCWVTRHPRIFRRLTGCQRSPGKWGATQIWNPLDPEIRQSEALFSSKFRFSLVQFGVLEHFWYLCHKLNFTHPN